MPTKVVHVEGMVADASADGTLILNVGSSAGLKVGDMLAVKRVGRKITRPGDGKSASLDGGPVGEVKITEVDASSAVGKFSGSGAPKVGDVVSTSREGV